MNLLDNFFSTLTFRKVGLYHLYMDNYFTSLDLFVHLRKMGLHSIGTIRENRIKEKNYIDKKSTRHIRHKARSKERNEFNYYY